MIDENAVSNSLFFTDEALLSHCIGSSKDIACPFCHHIGEWSIE